MAILVVGDVMLDRRTVGTAMRFSPEAATPVVLKQESDDTPGGAANVAANVASLGGRVFLLGVAGRDEAGTRLTKILSHCGVTSKLIPVDGPTICKCRIVSQGQQLLRLDIEQLPMSADDELCASIDAVVQPSSGLTSIVISDYNKGLFNQRTAAHLLQCARAINVPVFVDTKPVNVPLYRGATLLKLNLEEARQCMDRLHIVHPALAAAAQPSSEDLAQLAATTLLGHYGFGAVVITRHSDGASYAVAGPLPPGQSVLPTHHVACTAQRVYDVSGAGDTFLAALAVASADKMSFEAAVRFANTASGIAVQYHGTARVSRVEVDEAVYRNGGVAAKVMDDAALLRLVSRRREADRSIVLANGCFDLLHAGHISLLERAARFGGVLVVAVNDDASLRQLKGQDRPFVPLDDRLRHLASLSSVDAVVVFDGDAEALVRRVKPDVLVKGGDTDCVAGADYVASQGGRVELLPVTIVAHSTNLRKGD